MDAAARTIEQTRLAGHGNDPPKLQLHQEHIATHHHQQYQAEPQWAPIIDVSNLEPESTTATLLLYFMGLFRTVLKRRQKDGDKWAWSDPLTSDFSFATGTVEEARAACEFMAEEVLSQRENEIQLPASMHHDYENDELHLLLLPGVGRQLLDYYVNDLKQHLDLDLDETAMTYFPDWRMQPDLPAEYVMAFTSPDIPPSSNQEPSSQDSRVQVFYQRRVMHQGLIDEKQGTRYPHPFFVAAAQCFKYDFAHPTLSETDPIAHLYEESQTAVVLLVSIWMSSLLPSHGAVINLLKSATHFLSRGGKGCKALYDDWRQSDHFLWMEETAGLLDIPE
ncbi:unnamed protein product [Sympodiomycopsis kandeliae]